MSLSPSEIIENPCEEIIPANSFPFKSNRISRSVKFFNYLIFFPFYVEYKKCKHLYTFDFKTLEWASVELKNSPEILEITNNYTVSPFLENHFILFGCYKTFAAAQGQLTLEWKQNPTTGLPYLEKFSANRSESRFCIFGGYDENGKVSNSFYEIDFGWGRATFHFKITGEGKLRKWQISDEQEQKRFIPARGNHGSCDVDDLIIFGGEDQFANEINDLWKLKNPFGVQHPKYTKLYKQTISRRPKLGTPSLCFNGLLFYIGKSSSEVIAPIRSYLCIEEFYEEPKNQTQTYSPKKYLPFDGVPHTLEIFKDKLVLGYESSLYTILIRKFISEEMLTPCEEEAWSVNDIKPFDSDDVSLVKKSKKANFKDHIRQYFAERPHPDITFKVQDQEIKAHKGILSVRSRYFLELFTNEAKDKNLKNSIEIDDLSPAAFTILLEWLYCNNILEMKAEVAVELLKTTDKYLVPKLKEEAEKNLVKSLTLENLRVSAELAVDHKAKDLESAVVKLAAKEIDKLKERKDFDLLPSSIIDKALKSGK